jgi:ribonuclease HII
MYIIDFEKKQVVHKADSKMTSVVMQSVFFSMVHKDENLQFYDRVKQFVEEQESIGN